MSSVSSSTLSSLTSTSTGTTSTGSTTSGALLSQSDFLELLTTQLEYQDPSNPVDNTEFVSEMAQFSQLEATDSINTTVSGLATSLDTSQALSSAGLVGQYVMVPGTSITYTSGSDAVGAVDMTSAGTVDVTVSDSSGNTITTIPVTATSSGLTEFEWDGTDSSGNAVTAGTYTISATSGTTSLTTYTAGEVVGVTPPGSSGSTTLDVEGVGEVALSDVAKIY
ncbi:flagellar hook assembly protein FlgD [Frateuria aurantia]